MLLIIIYSFQFEELFFTIPCKSKSTCGELHPFVFVWEIISPSYLNNNIAIQSILGWLFLLFQLFE